MRILVLSDKVLRRSLGDGLRVHGLLSRLAHKHRLDLTCFADSGDRLDPEWEPIFQNVTYIPTPPRGSPPLLRRILSSVSSSNFKMTSDEMKSALAQATNAGRYDLVLEEAANTIPNLPQASLDVPLVVDSIDEPVLREVRAFLHGPWRSRPGNLYRAWRFWRYEHRMLARAALNIYVSEVDADVYRRLFPGRPVAVIPNGVDIEMFRPRPALRQHGFIAFEGNMNFGPNVDTAKRLVKDIYPLVLKRTPEARIGLIGRDPAPEVQALAGDNVEVTGTVDDVRPYLARASVFACPMRLGSGIKNKILQAWSMGIPVVATSASLGGLSASDGVNIVVRDDREAFAAAVADLIRDRDWATAIGEAGRNTALVQYSWQKRADELEALLRRAVELHGSPMTFAYRHEPAAFQ
jgi:glycosyltransferase involved in cell wall biosynthesis